MIQRHKNNNNNKKKKKAYLVYWRYPLARPTPRCGEVNNDQLATSSRQSSVELTLLGMVERRGWWIHITN